MRSFYVIEFEIESCPKIISYVALTLTSLDITLSTTSTILWVEMQGSIASFDADLVLRFELSCCCFVALCPRCLLEFAPECFRQIVRDQSASGATLINECCTNET
jgi:hypothetical protein